MGWTTALAIAGAAMSAVGSIQQGKAQAKAAQVQAAADAENARRQREYEAQQYEAEVRRATLQARYIQDDIDRAEELNTLERLRAAQKAVMERQRQLALLAGTGRDVSQGSALLLQGDIAAEEKFNDLLLIADLEGETTSLKRQQYEENRAAFNAQNNANTSRKFGAAEATSYLRVGASRAQSFQAGSVARAGSTVLTAASKVDFGSSAPTSRTPTYYPTLVGATGARPR